MGFSSYKCIRSVSLFVVGGADLNMAEGEFSVLQRQCLDRRMRPPRVPATRVDPGGSESWGKCFVISRSSVQIRPSAPFKFLAQLDRGAPGTRAHQLGHRGQGSRERVQG